jgi:hypothetical protein
MQRIMRKLRRMNFFPTWSRTSLPSSVSLQLILTTLPLLLTFIGRPSHVSARARGQDIEGEGSWGVAGCTCPGSVSPLTGGGGGGRFKTLSAFAWFIRSHANCGWTHKPRVARVGGQINWHVGYSPSLEANSGSASQEIFTFFTFRVTLRFVAVFTRAIL